MALFWVNFNHNFIYELFTLDSTFIDGESVYAENDREKSRSRGDYRLDGRSYGVAKIKRLLRLEVCSFRFR